MRQIFLIFLALFSVYFCSFSQEYYKAKIAETPTRKPLRVVIDLNIGESKDVELSNGDIVNIKLLDIFEIRDGVRNAIRLASAKVAVDSKEIIINSANYNLPVNFRNIQIDCTITKDYYKNADTDRWGLEKDARLRLWPAGSPFIAPGTFIYPVKQRWFASDIQLGNEPDYVPGGEPPSNKTIYYHSGADIAGTEGTVEVISATDGLVVASGLNILPGYENTPVHRLPAKDMVYITDDRGWFYRYSHLHSIDPDIIAGKRVKMGQKVGLVGTSRCSWPIVHFEMKTNETSSGKFGTEENYTYLWESYVRQYKPSLIAVARPHHLAAVGETITLDGLKSKSFAGEIINYEWTFTDGSVSFGPVQQKSYNRPGEYSEVLKITDSKGNIDYDFAIVLVPDKNNPPPTINATYYPTFNIKPGDPVRFEVCTYRTDTGNEIWDFGDGTPPVKVKSVGEGKTLEFAKTTNRFAKPGHYIVRVERSDKYGYKAIAHLHIEVIP